MHEDIYRAGAELLDDLGRAVPASASELADEITVLRKRLEGPLSVAIAGLIKGGKSTLINALLGEPLLASGADETTFNMNRLRYGDTRGGVILWLNGRQDRRIEPGKLWEWTRRQSAPTSSTDVREVVFTLPNPILQRMELIDTPGLGSSHEIDSAKTVDFLKIAEEVSERAASEADAIIFVLKRNMHGKDDDVMRAFRGDTDGRVSPLNAVGVLGLADANWPMAADPMAAARRVADTLKTKEQVKAAFFDVVPVSAQLGLARAVLNEEHRATLAQLVQLEDAAFNALLAMAERFTREHPDSSLPNADARASLLKALGLYGVHRMRQLMRERDYADAIAQLHIESGVPQLAALLDRHFGERAYLIKLMFGLHRLRTLGGRLAGSAVEGERRIGRDVLERIERFVLGSRAVLGLELLRCVYGGQTGFNDAEIAEIKAVTGEVRGASDSSTRQERSAVVARVSYWRTRANDARFGAAASEFPARAMCRLLEAKLETEG